MNKLITVKTTILRDDFTFKVLCFSLVCLFFSSVKLKSQTIPIPTIDSVTVASNNQVRMAWHVEHDVSITRFVIYRKTVQDFAYIAIDTVSASSPYTYIDNNVDVINENWLYTIASMSSTDSLSGMSLPHSYITFDFEAYHLCQSELNLSWSSYVGSTNVKYSTICISNGVDVDNRNHGNNNYGSTSVIRGESHLIAVRATWDTGSSTSAFRPYTADTINISKNSSVSIIDNSGKTFNIEVKNRFYRDTDSAVLYTYKNNLNSPHSRISVKPDLSGTAKFTVKSTKEIYFFKPAIIDICGTEYDNSLAVESILLKHSDTGDDIILQWNSVNSVLGLNYKLFKDDGQVELIESFTSGNSYRYIIESDAGGAERICFYIQATNDTLSIFSNVVCITLHDDLLWPNAFVPDGDGVNDTFGPVVTRFYPETFTMTIYNKQGATLFLTHSVDRKWNGVYNGSLVPKGAYIWQAEYTISGRKITKKGIVNIIY
ncbi:MAG: gliding motility-associated C-terminal domain-containing protein [Salinivirgaceae bacterium]|jgi:gliding motility-associated-like protein